MASASAIRAGEAFVEIFAEDGALRSKLIQTRAWFQSWGRSMQSAASGIFNFSRQITAPFFKGLSQFTDIGSQLALMSERTGYSVESLSALRYAAQQTRTPLSAIEIAIRRLSLSINGTTNQSKQNRRAFAELGITLAQLQALKPEDQLKLVGQRLEGIGDSSKKMALAVQIMGQFGRGGTQLLNIFAHMQQFTKEAQLSGQIWTRSDAFGALALRQRLTLLSSTLDRLRQLLGSALLPIALRLTAAFESILAIVVPWVEANKRFALYIVAGAAALAALAGILYVAGTAFTFVSAAIAIVEAGIGAIGAAIGGFVAILAAIFSPMVLISAYAAVVVAGVIAMGAAFLYLTAQGANLRGVISDAFMGIKAVVLSAIDAIEASITHGGIRAAFAYFAGVTADLRKYLYDSFEGIKADVMRAFGAMKDALMAADWQLAAQILWATLKLEFLKGMAVILQVTEPYIVAFADTFIQAVTGVRLAWDAAVHFVAETWAFTVAALESLWISFTNVIATTWDQVTGVVAKGMNELHEAWSNITGGNFKAAPANAAIDQQNAANEATRDQAQLDAEKQIQSDMNAKLKAAADKYADAILAVKKAESEGTAAEAKKALENLLNTDAEIKALQKQLDDFQKQAKKEAEDPNSFANRLKQLYADFDQRLDGLEHPAATTAAAAGKSIGGFFNSAAAFGIGDSGRDHLKRIEENGRQTAENTKRIADKSHGQGRFGH